MSGGWDEGPAAFLALDFETTGLDPRRDRVVEVGALRFAARPGPDGRPVFSEDGALSALVAPRMRMPAAAFAVHGISDAELEGALPFELVAPALLALCGDAVIVAHNAPFDLSFLAAELARAGLPAPRNASHDTRLLAKRAFPGAGSYRLGSLASYLGLEAGRAHRALDDARTCMGILAACARAEGRLPAPTPAPAGAGRA